MSIIKTIIPQICDINLASTTELLKKYSDYLDILSNFTDEVKVSLEYRDTFFKNDTINSRINFFNTLDTKLKDFDVDFIAYWYEIFNSSPEYIKSKVTTKNLRFERKFEESFFFQFISHPSSNTIFQWLSFFFSQVFIAESSSKISDKNIASPLISLSGILKYLDSIKELINSSKSS